MFRYLVISAVVFSIACKDRPYGEENSPQKLIKVQRHFNGTVFMGSPIAGASVKAFEMTGLKRGELLGQTSSNERGDYEISFQSAYKGPILLEAAGGHYRDLISHEDSVLDSSKPLLSAIPHTDLISATNINAWTTIAMARIFATKGFWSSRVKDLEPKLRIEEDFAAISHFLSKEGIYVNIAKTPPITEWNSLTKSSASLRLHLSHGGLAILVKRANEESKQKTVPITLGDLVQALSDDMENRKFDGKDSLDNRIRFSKLAEKHLSSYTLRNDLASAISEFIHGDDHLNQNETKTTVIEVQRSMLKEIAGNKAPELFSEYDLVEPIEKKKPILTIQFLGQHKEEIYFPIFKGDVKVSIKASDDTGISELELLEPNLGVIKNGEPIELDRSLAPQSSKALEACKDIDPKLIPKGLGDEKRPAICICAKAVDSFLNEAFALQCFEREKPKFEAKSPPVDTIINVKELSQGVNLVARASSGYPITDCSWEIGWVRDKIMDPNYTLPSGQGQINGVTCLIEHQLTQENMPFDGHFQLKVRIIDAAGQAFEEGYNEWQGHSFRIHAEPPEIEIISPKEGVSISGKMVKIVAKQLSKGEMDSVWVELWKEGDWSTSKNFRASLKDDVWTALIEGLNSYENYTYKVHAKALNGAIYQSTFRSLWIDDEPPQILGSPDGVPQELFTNEIADYSLHDSTILPVGAPLSIWNMKKSTPKVSRWINRLNDEKSAPSYRIKVRDNIGVNEVRYSIALDCLPLEKTTRNIKLIDSSALIKIVPSNSNEDLTKLRERELCLSIWAIDKAGNAANHTQKILWSTLAPPLKVAFNEPEIQFDDLSDFGNTHKDPNSFISFSPKLAKLSAGTIIGHVAIKNPHKEMLDVILSRENSIELKILLKRRLTLANKNEQEWPFFMRKSSTYRENYHTWPILWGILNPFVPMFNGKDFRDCTEGSGCNVFVYNEKRCNKNELVVVSGEPRYTSTNTIPAGIQNLDCISVPGFPQESFLKLFSANTKEIELDSEVKTISISNDYLEKEIFVFDRKQNELLEEISGSVNKITLNSDAEVLVKIKLKRDFPISIPTENRAADLCAQLDTTQQEQYKGRFFGSCLYALSSNDLKESHCVNGSCSSHFLFQTVEEVGFKVAKRYESVSTTKKIFLSEMPKANFKYRVNVHESEESHNNISVFSDLPQNERKRSFAKR